MNTLLLTGGGAALAALLMFGGKKSTPKGGGGGRAPWLVPIWVPAGPNGDNRIREEICRQTDPAITVLTPALAESVWKVIWQGVPWPVLPTDHVSVRQAAGILNALIGEYLLDPVGFCEAFDPQLPDIEDLPDADPKPGPQPIDISKLEDVYPTAGLMYQVVTNDILGGTFSTRSIAYRALLSAGYKAATQVLGLDDEAAKQFALNLAKQNAARAIYIRLMQCDLFNDFYYSTEGYNKEINTAGPHGRGIRLLKIHASNRSRLAQGLTPLREIDIISGSGKSGGQFEYLHLPLLDLERLANTNLSLDDRLAPGVWADGSTGMLPPPEIQAVLSTAGLPKGTYGCSPNTINV